MSDNSDIRPWVSIGEAAVQVLGKMASAMEEKLEGEQLFLARISALADHDTDSGQTMMDTEDLRRLIEITERYRNVVRNRSEQR